MYVDDTERLRHMLKAALQSQEFIKNKNRDDLDSNPMLLQALVRDIEIIGEAANYVTDEFKSKHPEIPWIRIIGMRNRLIHGYFYVDLNIVWDTVMTDIPALINQVKELCGEKI